MDYGMIGKIEKAKRYAQERHRFHVEHLTVRIDGENNSHTIRLDGDKWACDCDFFLSHGTCAHRMAIEHLLAGVHLPA